MKRVSLYKKGLRRILDDPLESLRLPMTFPHKGERLSKKRFLESIGRMPDFQRYEEYQRISDLYERVFRTDVDFWCLYGRPEYGQTKEENYFHILKAILTGKRLPHLPIKPGIVYAAEEVLDHEEG